MPRNNNHSPEETFNHPIEEQMINYGSHIISSPELTVPWWEEDEPGEPADDLGLNLTTYEFRPNPRRINVRWSLLSEDDLELNLTAYVKNKHAAKIIETE